MYPINVTQCGSDAVYWGGAEKRLNSRYGLVLVKF